VHHSRDRMRNISEIQDVTRWVKIRKRSCNIRLDDNRLARMARNAKRNERMKNPPGIGSDRRCP